ncbi:MAG TPA: 50S ribosomal protein L6 [Candidatus Saccharimonadales bacterium]|nr:50S ribosomal protein L6 [Candidatus Saccharimonadales bacterium]
MSRIGKMLITIPQGVTVTVENTVVKVKGPKGELSVTLRPEVEANVSGQELRVTTKVESKNTSAYWGLTRALLANMVKGVTEGFEKKLELIGVGYRAKENGKNITLTLGFSHPVEFPAPEGITLEVVDTQNVTIKGIDKQLVGQTAAKIRAFRKPEPYKGKGIKYAGEFVRRKVGKSGKV